MSDHSVLSPSSSHLWGICSAAPKANAYIPNFGSEWTELGNALHWAAAEILFSRLKGNVIKYACDFKNVTAPNGVLIEAKHLEGIDLYVEHVTAKANKHNAWGGMCVEQRVSMPSINSICYGTVDCFIPVLDKNYIYCYDFKSGHSDVKAEGNNQLILYANGIRDYLEINGIEDQNITIVLIVVQPFAYNSDGPVRTWSLKLSELRPHWNQLEAKAWEALNDPKMTSGPWCKNCNAVGRCSAARKRTYNFIDLVSQPYEIDSMDGSDLATERRVLKEGIKVATERLAAIDDQLEHMVGEGDTSSGLILKTKPGRLVWKDDASKDQIKILCKQFGADPTKDELLTPKQTLSTTNPQQRIMLGIVLKQYTTTGKASKKLVDASETLAFKAFNNEGKNNATI